MKATIEGVPGGRVSLCFNRGYFVYMKPSNFILMYFLNSFIYLFTSVFFRGEVPMIIFLVQVRQTQHREVLLCTLSSNPRPPDHG